MTTKRTLEDGRLFAPIEWDHGWSLSLQADRRGYQCSPQERLPNLEDYDSVEGQLRGPFDMPVDVSTMDMPKHVKAKFRSIRDGNPATAGNLSIDDIEHIKMAVLKASLNPNVGVPEGRFGWPGRRLYHGTSAEDAASIVESGIDPAKSGGGYFGVGFYMAEDRELAKSNYADFNDTDAGAVVEADVADGANILDMRNEKDYAKWQAFKLDIGQRDFLEKVVKLGIDGLYDRSFGGVVIYNAEALGSPRAEYLPSGPKI